MKLPSNYMTLGLLFLVVFILIKGFNIGELLSSFF